MRESPLVGPGYVSAMRGDMALFGMVWLLRVRSEMRRCAKCRRQEQLAAAAAAASSNSDAATTFFTIDAPGPNAAAQPLPPVSPGHAPTTYCEVHGFVPPKEDIQEFYELTLLDDSKTIQQKTAETIRIANKWEASDGPITPSYTNNDVYALFLILAVVVAAVYSNPLGDLETAESQHRQHGGYGGGYGGGHGGGHGGSHGGSHGGHGGGGHYGGSHGGHHGHGGGGGGGHYNNHGHHHG